jgi:hypothetical protein
MSVLFLLLLRNLLSFFSFELLTEEIDVLVEIREIRIPRIAFTEEAEKVLKVWFQNRVVMNDRFELT